jgi:hypothetical protein
MLMVASSRATSLCVSQDHCITFAFREILNETANAVTTVLVSCTHALGVKH